MASYVQSVDYKAYSALEKRPLGMSPFEDEGEGLIVAAGELFCRVNVAKDPDQIELCDYVGKFSHTGNLRVHIKGHRGENVKCVRKGTISAQENRDLKGMISTVLLWPNIATRRLTITLLPSAVNTPVKGKKKARAVVVVPSESPSPEPPKKTHRPTIPLKKNGSWNLAEMRRIARFTPSQKCGPCKAAKIKCPREDEMMKECELVEVFTDFEGEEDEEEEDEEENEI